MLHWRWTVTREEYWWRRSPCSLTLRFLWWLLGLEAPVLWDEGKRDHMRVVNYTKIVLEGGSDTAISWWSRGCCNRLRLDFGLRKGITLVSEAHKAVRKEEREGGSYHWQEGGWSWPGGPVCRHKMKCVETKGVTGGAAPHGVWQFWVWAEGKGRMVCGPICQCARHDVEMGGRGEDMEMGRA